MRVPTAIVPPGRLHFTAFWRRFQTTCWNRVGSASTRWSGRGQVDLDPDPGLLGLVPADLDGLVDQGVGVDGLGAEPELAPPGPHHVEQVVDQPGLQGDVAADHLQGGPEVRRDRGLLEQGGDHRQDRGQRGPQLVREDREEPVLDAAGGLGGLLGLAELGLDPEPLGDLGPHGLVGLGQLGGPLADAELEVLAGPAQLVLGLLPLGDVADDRQAQRVGPGVDPADADADRDRRAVLPREEEPLPRVEEAGLLAGGDQAPEVVGVGGGEQVGDAQGERRLALEAGQAEERRVEVDDASVAGVEDDQGVVGLAEDAEGDLDVAFGTHGRALRIAARPPARARPASRRGIHNYNNDMSGG